MDQLVTKVSQIDGTVNDQDNGLLKENANLKDEIQLLMKTCKSYEDRFVEMETEVQVSFQLSKVGVCKVISTTRSTNCYAIDSGLGIKENAAGEAY